MQQQDKPKKMFKVICPVERAGGGGTWWMRVGNAFLNRDDSINVYLESLPLTGLAKNDGIKLQLREYTEVELRERAEKRASYASRGTLDPNGLPSVPYGDGAPKHGSHVNDQVPF